MKTTFRAKIWKYDDPAAWMFVSLPKKLSTQIRNQHGKSEEGWGRLKVRAEVKGISWDTAIWFDTKQGGYLLPIKAVIRKQLGLKESSLVQVTLNFMAEENLFRSWEGR